MVFCHKDRTDRANRRDRKAGAAGTMRSADFHGPFLVFQKVDQNISHAVRFLRADSRARFLFDLRFHPIVKLVVDDESLLRWSLRE